MVLSAWSAGMAFLKQRSDRPSKRAAPCGDEEVASSSDRAVQRLSSPVVVVSVAIVLALVLGLFQLHGSSIGMFHVYLYGADTPDPNLLFGRPRPIRSDEFQQATINFLAQRDVGFPTINPNRLLAHQPGSNSRTPTLHWRALFRPMTWPAFVLPVESGFAVWWWLRIAFLFGSAYTLFHHLTRRDVALSAFGALAVTYAPHIQWFLNDTFVEFAICFFAGLWLVLRVLEAATFWRAAAFAAGLCYVAGLYTTTVYPPMMVGVGLLAVLASLAVTVERVLPMPRRRALSRLGLLLLTPLAVGVLFLLYRIESADQIEAMLGAANLGQRTIVGGTYTLPPLLSSLFNIELLSDWDGLALGLANQSEASSFPFFAPFLVPLTLWSVGQTLIRREGRIAWLDLAILAFLVLALAWMYTGLPPLVVKLLMFEVLPHGRLLLPIGLASTLYVVLALSRPNPLPPKLRLAYGVVAAVACLLLHLWVGSRLVHQPPLGLDTGIWIALVASVAAALALALVLQWRRAFMVGLLSVTLLSSASVNPLYRGFDPVLNAPFSAAVREIVAADGDRPRWMPFNSHVIAPLLLANGAATFGHYQVTPPAEFWDALDPTGAHAAITNRYAQLTFISDVPVGGTRVELKDVNAIFVHVNPCDPALDQLRVRYVASVGALDLPCLRLVKEVPLTPLGMQIYRRAGL